MPSPVRKGGRRVSINTWRVKHGRHDVYSGREGDCRAWVRQHQGEYDHPLRIVPPNS